MSDRLCDATDTLNRAFADKTSFCDAFLSLTRVTGVAVSTLGGLLGTQTLCASDKQAARLDEVQFDLGEGPCWDALSLRQPVHAPQLSRLAATRWPAFARAISTDEIASIYAFPLLVGPLRLGAVDLYSRRESQLAADQSAEVGALADLTARHVLRRALSDLDTAPRDDTEIERGFSRRLFHQATGMVLAQLDVNADDAALLIRGHAFANSVSVLEVAQEIVDRRLDLSAGEPEQREGNR